MKILFLIVLTLLTISILPNSHAKEPAEFINSKTTLENNMPFSEMVKVGDLIFMSGQIGFDNKSKKVVEGGISAEAYKTMDNIKNTLEHHGYSMKNVVKCTVMLADIKEWSAFNEEYVKFFSKPYPARSAFAASGLALNSRVEVECIASVK